MASTGIGGAGTPRYSNEATSDEIQHLKEQVLQTAQAHNWEELAFGAAGHEALILQGKRFLLELNWESFHSTTAVCEALNSYYEKSAEILIEDPAPPKYLAGPHEIMATAVNMRESIYVLDVTMMAPCTSMVLLTATAGQHW